ncbi:hypothetical protein [Streptomyces sp. MUM 178J]|uniref:hypothetical protein n=1 Tax=Streptomyces sp. MUM 178J TaxID=2791991 RepID=UPI001F03A37E|nr:hypothetical protein [Streptomyces sp. MUM 178J]WRQ80920.1 hypothetical protein I3F59_017015 [Streptomyces sp. MUM 178J]
MPTYEEIMQTDLGKLSTAADKWESMAGEFKKADKRYEEVVKGVTLSPWTGVSATGAVASFANTRYEYAAAQTQAKAIADLLRDAHTQFVDLKKRLDDTVAAAVKAGMKVSEYGIASFDYSKATPAVANAARHDPDLRDYEMTHTQNIRNCVNAITDADAGVKIALAKVVKDVHGGKNDGTWGTGFNASAQGDVEKYEAQNTADIATKINNGEKVSTAELNEFQRSMRDNTRPGFDDRTFSQTFLNSLGPNGTVKLATKLDALAYLDDKDNRATYLGVKNGFADTLAHATKDPKFAAKWREDIRAIGTKEFDGPRGEGTPAKGSDGKIRGYQAVMGLVKAGDPNSFDGAFLGGLANDIYAVEKDSKGDIWDINQSYNQKNSPWFANDPLDSALGMLSHHPDEATKFLDPGDKTEGSKLEYLLKERDWKGIVPEYSEWGKVETTRVGHGDPLYDEDVREGLGSLLEAATTGREPGSPGTEMGRHSEAQARIMHDTINLLDYGNGEGKAGDRESVGKADEVLGRDDYANVRDSLARSLASYSPDMVDILTGEGPGGRTGEKNPHINGEDSEIQNSKSSILRIMRGVSEVPDGSAESKNFNLLYQAQQGYMTEQFTQLDPTDKQGLDHRARKAGEVFGMLTAVGGDLALDARDEANSEASDKRFYGYHAGGSLITGIPVIGDVAQRTLDMSLNKWMTAVHAENGLLAREQLSAQNDAAQDALDSYFEAWGKENNRSTSDIQRAMGEAGHSYGNGRRDTFEALRSRS